MSLGHVWALIGTDPLPFLATRTLNYELIIPQLALHNFNLSHHRFLNNTYIRFTMGTEWQAFIQVE